MSSKEYFDIVARERAFAAAGVKRGKIASDPDRMASA